jgi:hypothetical protein
MKDDGFTQIYNGFEKIYRQDIDIPEPNDRPRCMVYDGSTILTKRKFSKCPKRKNRVFSNGKS